MLYTLKGNEIEVVAIVLYIVDHKEYDGILGYKGRRVDKHLIIKYYSFY